MFSLNANVMPKFWNNAATPALTIQSPYGRRVDKKWYQRCFGPHEDTHIAEREQQRKNRNQCVEARTSSDVSLASAAAPLAEFECCWKAVSFRGDRT